MTSTSPSLDFPDYTNLITTMATSTAEPTTSQSTSAPLQPLQALEPAAPELIDLTSPIPMEEMFPGPDAHLFPPPAAAAPFSTSYSPFAAYADIFGEPFPTNAHPTAAPMGFQPMASSTTPPVVIPAVCSPTQPVALPPGPPVSEASPASQSVALPVAAPLADVPAEASAVDSPAPVPNAEVTQEAAPEAVNPEEAAATDPPTTTAARETPSVTTTTTTTTAPRTTAITATTTALTTRALATTAQQNAQFNESIARCNNCLVMIRKLRKKQDSATGAIFNYIQNPENSLVAGNTVYIDFSVMMQEIMSLFNALTLNAKRLPVLIPPIVELNWVLSVYGQEKITRYSDIGSLIDRMINCGNWSERNYQVFYYLSQLLRGNVKTERFSVLGRRPFNPPALTAQATTAHSIFENAYNAMRGNVNLMQTHGIYPRTLHRTATSLVIEIQFGTERIQEGGEKEIVYTIKFLLVERYGNVEFINIIATHEDWDTYNDFGAKQVNPYTLSRYNYYQKLTKHANANFIKFFAGIPWTSSNFRQLVTFISNFRAVTSARCGSCGNILKDWMPPVRFDIRTPTIAFHETCPR